MKALQCVELGMPDKLQINEVANPTIMPDHVLIDNLGRNFWTWKN